MKRKYFLCILVMALISSCSELEETPYSFVNPESFYRTSNDAIAATNAAYSFLVYYQAGFHLASGVVAGDIKFIGQNPQEVSLWNWSWDATNIHIEGLWTNMYKGIYCANTVIDRVPNIQMNEELRARLVAEALFLRALFYFDLVRNFGEVPLVTSPQATPNDPAQPKASLTDIYDQIIEDLESAEQTLPLSYSGPDVGRATQGAAKALLAKVHLTIGDWQAAATKAQEVIDLGRYSLEADFSNLWNMTRENGIESIFEVQFIRGSGYGTNAAHYFAPQGTNIFSAAGAYGVFVADEEFVGSFEENDYRQEVTFITSFVNRNGAVVNLVNPHITKFFDPLGTSQGDYGNNFPILRFADVLLIHSEALNEIDPGSVDKYDGINLVRDRANLLPLEGMDQETFRAAVLKERNFEFVAEGQRIMDLRRRNLLVEDAIGRGVTNAEPFRVVFPIPLRELQSNDQMQQTDGY